MRRSPNRLLPFLVLALAAIFATAAHAAGPKAVTLLPIQDFNTVAKGEVLEHDFQIRNDGDAVLEIQDVRPSCGCTVARFDEKIAPGQVGTVHTSVDTTDFFGPISKSVTVITNDAENPKLTLVVKAKVAAYVSALPGYARFLYVQGEPTAPLKQVLWSADDHPLKITEVKADTKKLDVFFRLANEDEKEESGQGPQWVVGIEIRDDAPIGPVNEFVEVITDHPKQRTAKFPVSGFVRPRQHVTPDEADFGKLQGDSLPLRRTFTFTNFATQQIEVTKVETGFEAMTAEIKKSENQPGHRFRVVLSIGKGMPKGEFDTVIKIHTSDAQSPVIELPIKGIVL